MDNLGLTPTGVYDPLICVDIFINRPAAVARTRPRKRFSFRGCSASPIYAYLDSSDVSTYCLKRSRKTLLKFFFLKRLKDGITKSKIARFGH